MGAGLGEERTLNIQSMLVTLEVSKLSGWLNALAVCRVEMGARTMRGEVRGREAGGSEAAATLNISSMVVTLEVSQLEMSALKFCKPKTR